MRRWIAVTIGMCLAVLFGSLVARAADWSAVGSALRQANWLSLAWVPVLLMGSVFMRALRWRLILRDHAPARVGRLTLAAGIGVGANAVLPGKLGEAVAAHALGRLADLSRVQSLGLMIVTRIADVLIVFALVLGASFVLPSETIRAYRGVSLAAFAIALAILVAPIIIGGPRFQPLRTRVEQFVAARLGAGPADFLRKFARGLASADRLADLALFLLATVGLWCLFSAALLVTMKAFGIACPVTLAPFVLGLMAVSAMLPSAPGNVGTFHYFGVLALGFIGVESNLATASIIAYHAIDMLGALALGAISAILAGTPLLAWRTPPAEPPSAGLPTAKSAPDAGSVQINRVQSADVRGGVCEQSQPEVAAESV